MNDDELQDLFEEIEANVRPYAGYFSWQKDRDLEELGVVQCFSQSLEATGASFFSDYESRGAGNDPPDCEAILSNGESLGLEVTELVDGNSIKAAKAGSVKFLDAPFSVTHLLSVLEERIQRKGKPTAPKGGPYAQYIVIIYCDDPRVLDQGLIQYVREHRFSRPSLIDRAFLLLSYDPGVKRCPYVELAWAEA